MRDRDTEIEYIRAIAPFDRISVQVNGVTLRSVPSVDNLLEDFIRRTGDGEIRPHIISLGDKEAMEEATDGVAYGCWRNLYGDSTEYAKSLRAQAVAKMLSAYHLFYMAGQADEE